MIAKIVRKGNLKDFSEIEENLVCWLSKTSEIYSRYSTLTKL